MRYDKFATRDRKDNVPRIPNQILAILVFACLLLVGWNFSQRITMTLAQQQMEQSLDQQLAQAEATRQALQERKAFVQTDGFVEEQARGWHYVKDGETAVFPQKTPAAPAPASPAVPAPTPTPEPTWWDTIFNFFIGP